MNSLGMLTGMVLILMVVYFILFYGIFWGVTNDSPLTAALSAMVFFFMMRCGVIGK